MDWLATLRRSGGINAIARHVGTSPVDAGAGISALLPMVINGLRDYCARSGGGDAGVRSLIGLLGQMGDGDLAAQVMGPDPLRIDAGKALLDRLFGAGVTAEVDEAERSTDVARDLLDDLLPPLAMLVGGYIAARAGGSGGQGGVGPSGLGGLLDTLLTHGDDHSGSQRTGESSRS